MIPIRSIDGEIIGFGGRELPEKSTNYLASIKKIKSPGKYINTPTSKGISFFCGIIVILFFTLVSLSKEGNTVWC